MDYFFLDSWDLPIREIETNGYSQVVKRGAWNLRPLPRCPDCGKDVWPRILKAPVSVEFTGDRIGDIAFGFAATLIVSERFHTLWKCSDLDGLVFSDEPVDARFKKMAVLDTPSREFFAAYPEPEFVRLSDQSGAQYSEEPRCSLCSVGVVQSVDRALFEGEGPQTDFFMPSSLPGWFVVSDRVRHFVEDKQLKNFQFVEGFSIDDWQLIRHGYWETGADLRLVRRERVSFPAHL